MRAKYDEISQTATGQFRKAVTADIGAILLLTREAYAKWVPVIGREPRPMFADYKYVIREHLVDLYEVEGRLTGAIEMIKHNDYLLIENIAVLPDSQRQGVGDLLLSRAEDVAISLGYTQVRLYTNEAFDTNILFYRKRGFKIFSCGRIDSGGSVVRMKKEVKHARQEV